MRRHYLVTYDVSNDKRRSRIFQALLDHGDHTQFSVFLCQLDPAELAKLRCVLQPHIHHEQDQVLIVDLGQAHHDLDQSIEAMGKPFALTPRAHIV